MKQHHHPFQLSPTIWTDSMKTFVEEVEIAKTCSQVERVHVDIIDGQFTDNLTVTPLDLSVVDFGELGIDFHLMVEEPMDVVFECEAIREYLPIRRIIGQVERMSRQVDFLQEVQRNGWQAGLGLDVFTPIEAIDDECWTSVDTVLLMGYEAGHHNQVFNVQVLEKMKELQAQFEQLPADRRPRVLVDGGVKANNLLRILQAGADEVAVGGAVWRSRHPDQIVTELFATAEKRS